LKKEELKDLQKASRIKEVIFSIELNVINIKNDLILIELLKDLVPITKTKSKIQVNAYDSTPEVCITVVHI